MVPVVLVLLVSCAAPASSRPGSGARAIDLAAFAASGSAGSTGASGTAAPDPSGGTGEAGETRGTGARVRTPATTLGASDDRGSDWEPLPLEEPARSTARHIGPGESVIIDAMVGQVNGHPIFADTFFEPIADRLIALRDQVPDPGAYPAKAAPIVAAQLQLVVVNALFLAEAESDLTVEEQRGIQAWVDDRASRVISGFEGSEERARRAIYEAEGKSFEEHMQGVRDLALIERLVQERIARRVIVSWLDIEREYNRRIDEFRPDPRITIARIRVATSDTSLVDDISRRLGRGESLAAIAEAVGQAGDAAWAVFQPPAGDLAKVDMANETIKDQLAGLHAEGDVAGPFEVGRSTWWLGIASIVQEPVRDLYDPELQIELESHIRQVRGSEEQRRYIASLLDKGIYDELDGMAQRLLLIAIDRYGP